MSAGRRSSSSMSVKSKQTAAMPASTTIARDPGRRAGRSGRRARRSSRSELCWMCAKAGCWSRSGRSPQSSAISRRKRTARSTKPSTATSLGGRARSGRRAGRRASPSTRDGGRHQLGEDRVLAVEVVEQRWPWSSPPRRRCPAARCPCSRSPANRRAAAARISSRVLLRAIGRHLRRPACLTDRSDPDRSVSSVPDLTTPSAGHGRFAGREPADQPARTAAPVASSSDGPAPQGVRSRTATTCGRSAPCRTSRQVAHVGAQPHGAGRPRRRRPGRTPGSWST